MTRMIFDVSPEVQMAIRLRALKNGTTTGDVVRQAVDYTFPSEVEEAQHVKAMLEHGED